MNHDEMKAVIQAHKDGARIECRYLERNDDIWVEVGPRWNFYKCDYRIKATTPEPRVIWVNEYANVLLNCGHGTERLAREFAGDNAARTAVEYQEVIK